MRNKILIILFFICACIPPMAGQAQINLVRNPSLEQYTICPSSWDEISFAKYWNSLDTVYEPDSAASYGLCAPDYCNTCATWAGVSIPTGGYYYRYPRTGNAMTQVRIFYDESISFPSHRDYLQGKLYSNLIAGQSYCVTYYTNLENGSGYATNNVDAYLDDGAIDAYGYNCGMPINGITPQIIDTAIIYDTLNWVKIQGNFIANGTEKFITIGNFYDKTHTNYVAVTYPSGAGNTFGFYLIDDVSVIASNTTAYAGPDVTIAPGDSAWIGVDSNGEGMPCYWYVAGNTTPIDSGGRIAVHPTDSTTYVVSMDLCGTVTYDTVKVNVSTLGVASPGLSKGEVTLFPNPASTEVAISASGIISNVSISNLVGQNIYNQNYNTEKVVINISDLPPGIYFVKVNDTIVKKLVVR